MPAQSNIMSTVLHNIRYDETTPALANPSLTERYYYVGRFDFKNYQSILISAGYILSNSSSLGFDLFFGSVTNDETIVIKQLNIIQGKSLEQTPVFQSYSLSRDPTVRTVNLQNPILIIDQDNIQAMGPSSVNIPRVQSGIPVGSGIGREIIPMGLTDIWLRKIASTIAMDFDFTFNLKITGNI